MLKYDENYLLKYLSSSIETDSLLNPDRSYYSKNISEDEINIYREKLWILWKQANAKRLATWANIANQSSIDSLLWNLPDEKRMLFSLVKKGDRPDNGYPLFINLHGGGCFPNEKGPWTSPVNNAEWKAAKFLAGKYQDEPSLYFIPRMANDRRGRWYHRAEIAAWMRAWQLGVLSGDVDPDRAYIMGISEGGYGSFRMGVYLADYFAAAGPMAGPVWADQEPIENLRNTALRIEVGEHDNAYGRAQNARNWKLKLDSAAAANPGQFIHHINIQEGKSHGINYYNTSSWLKQFKRNSYPDTLSLRYYAQCDTIYGGEPGRPATYRKGFGYLRLDGLSETGERSFYLEKSGNTYIITSANTKGKVIGKLVLYADKVDFKQAVKVYYNNKLVFNSKVKPNIGTMTESLALFGDPKRIFPAAVEITVD